MTYKLICFDMDGVIFEDRNFWMELHKRFGTLEEGKVLTEKYLKTDYNMLVKTVVEGLWKGRDAQPYYELVNSIRYHEGVDTLFDYLHQQGYVTAIISTSAMDVARRVQQDYGVDHIYANNLVIKDGVVSGEFDWPLGAGHEKRAEIFRGLCEKLDIPLQEAVFVGDSDSDVDALSAAGLGIAFNPHGDYVRNAADIVIESNDLNKLIDYL